VRYLLDVNVWVALLDEAHVFHAQALAFIERPALKMATCPLWVFRSIVTGHSGLS
jgi:predicted nucleic acid-binding protein